MVEAALSYKNMYEGGFAKFLFPSLPPSPSLTLDVEIIGTSAGTKGAISSRYCREY
jgi:hypothetical protein